MEPYILKEVSTRAEMDAAVDVLWTSHHNPYRPSFQAFYPVFGATAADREAGILASKERIWKAHESNPASHWFYVEETKTGKVVGSTEWQLHERSPYVDGSPKLTAYWWPEGEGREFCTEMVRQAYAPRHRWLRRPHVGQENPFRYHRPGAKYWVVLSLVLNLMSVHPSHRRQGVGKLLMKWGLDRADEMGFEGWVEASESGKLLFETLGFRILIKISVNTSKADPSDEWRKLEHELTPLNIWIMWRPVNGLWEDGEMVLPWDLPPQGPAWFQVV